LYYLFGATVIGASITVQCHLFVQPGGAVGIDLGCKETITLSTGEQISTKSLRSASKNPPNRKRTNHVKNQSFQAMETWRSKVSKLQRKVARQRENWLHQTTNNIVSGNSLVAGEQLSVKG